MDSYVPDEFRSLLIFLKITGIDIEIESDFYKSFLITNAVNNNNKGFEETRKALFKLYYPDVKDASESLMEEMKKKVSQDTNPIMTIQTGSSKAIDPEVFNALFSKS